MTPKIHTVFHGSDCGWHVFVNEEDVFSSTDEFSRDLFVAVIKSTIKTLGALPCAVGSPQDRIRYHVRQVEMICAESGLDPHEWLADDSSVEDDGSAENAINDRNA